MKKHSVEDHLKLKVQDYDVMIRKLVPFYDELLREGVEILNHLVPADGKIIDLGSGTGRLSATLLSARPQAHLTLVDIDSKILDQARERLGEDNPRVEYELQSYLEPLPEADAVVASLSLHHVRQPSEKLSVCKNIFSALKTGGLFLCLDASFSSDPRLALETKKGWGEHMVSQGIAPQKAEEHFQTWSQEEFYFSLIDELNGLVAAGFQAPECFWRRGPLAIFGGIKN